VRLQDLAAILVGSELRGPGDVEVTSVAYDSRAVEAGALFCCVPGAVADGHAFAGFAVRAGAVALLVERWLDLGADLPGGAVPQLRVPDARMAMAQAAGVIWQHPSHDLTVIGVTGTNGKTTTTLALRSIFTAAGRRTEVRGTLSGARTTPEAPDLQRWLRAQADGGVDVVAMEVSSHALDLHRVDGTRFAAATFTNLSRDHLDFHRTMQAYFEAKARLFTPELAERAVVNLDDPYGRLLRDAATIPTEGYSLTDISELDVGAHRSRFIWRGHAVELQLGGRFNVANALAAAETARVLGVDDAAVAAGLCQPLDVPGRFQAIELGQPFSVIVDYAHTPDALEQVLGAASEIAGAGRVHVVFGAGGDRDRTKRPAMGAVAAAGADRVVLTADNSRHESTRDIIGAVRDGFDRSDVTRATELIVEEDRDAAIGLALRGADEGDIVVIAGKGHERTQTIGDVTHPFDDVETAERHLRALADPSRGSGA
jgi:UDP-N-acetylmuramoyl-L-alanyl-D-glutamate--2,6-diaminopimelate ligase